jgi:FixJ family two-component response regulator
MGRQGAVAPQQAKVEDNVNEPPRISIVDDDPSVRRALGRLCKSVGYRTNLYESAEDFVETLGTEKTDCLILDVHLPGRNGLELQGDLYAAKKHLPIIFVTAFEDDQAQRAAIESGAIEFLRKPLDSERLLDAIQRALDS